VPDNFCLLLKCRKDCLIEIKKIRKDIPEIPEENGEIQTKKTGTKGTG